MKKHSNIIHILKVLYHEDFFGIGSITHGQQQAGQTFSFLHIAC